MKTLVYSSVSIDITFVLDHFVVPGETEPCITMYRGAGGKGANQAAAMAKAGQKDVYFAAKASEAGSWIFRDMESFGVDTSFVKWSEKGIGEALIQVEKGGQNSIILYAGGNHDIQRDEIEEVFSHFTKGDRLVINAEINNLDIIFDKALSKGMEIAVNPSPVTKEILALPLEKASLLVVNEVEAKAVLGYEDEEGKMLSALMEKFPESEIILTAGEKGSWYGYKDKTCHQPIVKVTATDTVGAGDTFLGYYLASREMGMGPEEALGRATKASSITVTRPGAMKAIPFASEVD